MIAETKVLDLSMCKTNAEVVAAISKRVSQNSIEDLQEYVRKKFVFMDKTVDAIYIGLLLGKNVYLSGPGGYGKTSVVKRVLSFYGIPSHTVNGYKDMPVDALLGAPNINKFIKESEYEIAFEKSVFYKPGILLGEEFGDILPSTAAALKDILSDKGFRWKGGRYESLIGCMIITANTSPKEIADDESKKAFYVSRFPVKIDVVWDSFSKANYVTFLKTVFPEAGLQSILFLGGLFEDNHINRNNTISPRTAIDISTTFLARGIKYMQPFDIDLSAIHSILADAKFESARKTKLEAIKELTSLISMREGADVKTIVKTGYISARINDLIFSADVSEELKILKHGAYKSFKYALLQSGIFTANIDALIDIINEEDDTSS